MKRTLLIHLALVIGLFAPAAANASLGGDITSVRADNIRMQGTLRSTTNGVYTIQEVKAPTGVSVREYVSSNGKVFAVAWQGPVRPDLKQVLGTYFDAWKAALQASNSRRPFRGPLVVRQAGLVVEMGGHMRWLVGRAYIPEMVPPQVQLKEIR